MINFTDEQIKPVHVDCYEYWKEHRAECDEKCSIRCPYRERAIATAAQVALWKWLNAPCNEHKRDRALAGCYYNQVTSYWYYVKRMFCPECLESLREQLGGE